MLSSCCCLRLITTCITWILCTITIIKDAEGTHFRGGIFMWKPTFNGNESEVSLKLYLGGSYGVDGGCNVTCTTRCRLKYFILFTKDLHDEFITNSVFYTCSYIPLERYNYRFIWRCLKKLDECVYQYASIKSNGSNKKEMVYILKVLIRKQI
jgi:hypothetical protein